MPSQVGSSNEMPWGIRVTSVWLIALSRRTLVNTFAWLQFADSYLFSWSDTHCTTVKLNIPSFSLPVPPLGVLCTPFITINTTHCSRRKYVYCCHSLIGHLFNVFPLSFSRSFSLSASAFIVRSECIVRKSNTHLMIMDRRASEWREIGTGRRAGKSDPNISKVQT